jgi:hypothetical protein
MSLHHWSLFLVSGNRKTSRLSFSNMSNRKKKQGKKEEEGGRFWRPHAEAAAPQQKGRADRDTTRRNRRARTHSGCGGDPATRDDHPDGDDGEEEEGGGGPRQRRLEHGSRTAIRRCRRHGSRPPGPRWSLLPAGSVARKQRRGAQPMLSLVLGWKSGGRSALVSYLSLRSVMTSPAALLFEACVGGQMRCRRAAVREAVKTQESGSNLSRPYPS